jgi:hypothetical protein
MYFATLANSANNLYLVKRKQFANDLHNVLMLISTVHAFALDAIDMLEFMSQVWDEATDHITLAPYLPTFDNTVKECSKEVMEDMEQPVPPVVAMFALAFTQAFTAVTQTLAELKAQAKELGIKGWNFYTKSDKLTAKINEALSLAQ